MKKKKNVENKNAFTLAETMIVLAVIGVIAAITVPALVNNHVNSANRTKLKKAMTVYETALNKMVIENGIKDNAALYENANSFAPEGNCTNTAPYFKTSQTLNGNICTFKASDGTYWDISKINAPIIAFNEADLSDETATNRFQLVGHFDNATGSLRVNDLVFERGGVNEATLTKVYNYVNGVKGNTAEKECASEIICKMKKYQDTPCPQNAEYESNWDTGSFCKNCKQACTVNSGTNISLYDENGRYILWGSNCKNGKNCKVISTIERDENGIVTVEKYGCDSNGIRCTECYAHNGSCVKNSKGYYDPEDANYSDYPEDSDDPEPNYYGNSGSGSSSGLSSGSSSGFYSGSGSGY